MAIAGKSGKLTVVDSSSTTETVKKVIGITNWSLSLTVSTLDKTALGDDWKSYIHGLKEWTASASGNFEIGSTAPSGEEDQEVLQNALLEGTEVELKLYVDGTHYYSGKAIVASMSVDDTLEDVVNASFEFTGCGALSFE